MGALAFGVLWTRPVITPLAVALLLPAILTLAAAAIAARRLAATATDPMALAYAAAAGAEGTASRVRAV